jgi:hypothetical protein
MVSYDNARMKLALQAANAANAAPAVKEKARVQYE